MDLPRPEPFHPLRLARSPHLQTLLGNLSRGTGPDLPWTPALLDLEDGDVLALRLLEGDSGRVGVLFHGLGGTAGSAYMRRAAATLARRRHAVVAVHHRGVGEGRGLAIRPYHSGSTADMAAALALVRKRFPGSHLTAVGFSISANILLLLLGRDRDRHQPDAAIAVNPPGDLDASSLRLQRGWNRIYDLRFVRLLRREAASRRVTLPPTPSLRDFDEVYTARAAGFTDRADYYSRCSCGAHLSAIRVPTVILATEDDPLAPASDLGPVSEAVHLHVERRGGHMGFVGTRAGSCRLHHWLDTALDHYHRCLEPGGGGTGACSTIGSG
ncbi:MAG: alpha/beta fold hydrolase [Deltaproteobacteria bacterium]|nr:alpha/beta fold hydrolase [Deltaproteobacteria bacterium]